MRALISRDVPRVTESLFAERLLLMRERPSEPLITILDYTLPRPEISVDFLENARELDTHDEVHWHEHVSRAARSGGRMELHLMFVVDGNVTRPVMFPQRAESAVLHDGLVRISREIPGESGARDRVRDLLEANKNLVEIYQ